MRSQYKPKAPYGDPKPGTLGYRVREERQKHGWDMKQLGLMCGLSSATINRMERTPDAHATDTVIFRIAQAFAGTSRRAIADMAMRLVCGDELPQQTPLPNFGKTLKGKHHPRVMVVPVPEGDLPSEGLEGIEDPWKTLEQEEGAPEGVPEGAPALVSTEGQEAPESQG